MVQPVVSAFNFGVEDISNHSSCGVALLQRVIIEEIGIFAK